MQVVDQELTLVLERLVRMVRRLATAGDLSVPAAAVLTRLVREGPHRLTDLAAGEGVAQPGMTQLVTRLERDGLVRRISSAEDGRVVLVEVTPAGEQLVAQRRAQRTDSFSRLLSQLDPADREAIHAALPALDRLTDLALASPSPPSGAVA